MQEPIFLLNLLSKNRREEGKFSMQSQSKPESRDMKVPGNLFQSLRDSKVSQSKDRITIMTITATQGATTVTRGTSNNIYQE